ncbi:MFS general substrate transporter [Suhomyces tanzawaensis NRRL Y-17324]|uniref:MFS general substrate transporter n=1 Tax=Suhomyces tanzawaensis NRRL Y-17324 TaxID=984487 RepID=A0A1E4SC83_9ASCO|nr:MFS general substrate transporter [Suhomyces tanzawaensis NRRL Y-17324]ODV77088.1 MFS general substrate transporter [Suhomyces tanzawaensis NRRL Y-17324]
MNEEALLLPRKRSEQFHIDEPDQESHWIHEHRRQLSTLPWHKRPSFGTMGFILFLIALAASCGQPTKDSLNAKLACRASGQLYCDPVLKQVILSNLNLVCSTTTSIVLMVVLANVGPLSDSYGRSPFFCYYILANFLALAALLWVYRTYSTLKFWLIVLTSFISSLSGGNYSLLSLLNAYASDIVAPENRIYSLGLVSAAIFAGSTLGPMLGEFVLNRSSDITSINGDILANELVPIKVELCIQAVVMVFTFMFLRESRSKQALLRARADQASTPRTLVDAINFFKPLKLLALPRSVARPHQRLSIRRSRYVVVLLVTIEILMALVDDIVRTIITQYGIFRFNWSAKQLGYFLSINSLASAVVLMAISPLLNKVLFAKLLGYSALESQFDTIDFAMLLVALVNEIVSLSMLYTSTSTSEMFFAGNLLTISLIGGPAITSAMLKFYPESKVGEFFSAQSILKNALGIISPLVFQWLYKYSLRNQVANLSFGVYALIIMLCTGCLLVARRLSLATQLGHIATP